MKQKKLIVSARQRGAALVTTLLIVALITVTVTAMASKQQRAIQLAQNRQTQLQLKNLLGAGENFAMAILRRDHVDGERNRSDSTEDFWAQSLPPVPVDGATVEGCVIDLQGKFNLNNLVNVEGQPDEGEYQILQRLLTALTIDSTKAEAIRDWIDRDVNSIGANGAEDDFYVGQNPSYRAANGPMVSPSELLLVRGFRVTDEGGLEDYDQLLPHITTVPTGVAINVNTASGPLLAALAPHMPSVADEIKVVDDEYWEEYPGCPEGGGLLDSILNADDSESADDGAQGTAEEDLEEESAGGAIYEDITDFQETARLSEEEDVDELVESGSIGIQSSYFMARITVTRDDIGVTQFTIFERASNGALTTLRRSRGSL